MSAGQSAFMQSQMAYMKQELDSEFGEDNGDTSDDDDMSATTRSQSLSADFNRLTIAGVSSSQSTVIHGSSSSTVRADIVTPRHIIIPGDHTEVDNNFYQTNFNSNKEQNNIIENSFGEGKQENIGVWRMLGMFFFFFFSFMFFEQNKFNRSGSTNETKVKAST